MKKMNKYTLFAGVCMMSLLTACDYEDLNTNPFEMTDEEGIRDGFAVGGNVTAMQQAVTPVGTQADDTDIINAYQTAYHLSSDNWSGYFAENNSWDGGNNNTSFYQKDGWNSETYNWSYTKMLDPWKKLKASSEKNDTPDVFALAQILKISGWHKALESFGPMPYSHAADASLSIPFDSEKEVYTAMLADLTEAVNVLTPLAQNGVKVMPKYDAVYAGDAQKWVKYANSLILRLSMHIRFADEQMAKTYATQAVKHSVGLIKTVDEEAKMAIGAGMTFRNNIEWLSEQYNEARMGSSIFSYLVGLEDPRLPAYFKPVEGQKDLAVEAFDGQKYMALPHGHVYGQNNVFTVFSKPNFVSQTPTYWLRASEVYFLLAEAALVWGGEFGNAADLYKQGVTTSFQENGITADVDRYLNSGKKPVGHKLSAISYNFDFPAPCQTTAKFEGSQEQKLEKIITQKWLALYPNGQEGWTEWRRTGYPKLNPVMQNNGVSQGATLEKGVRRMLYPVKFYQTEEGKAVYDEALQKLGGPDKSNTRLWWDCKR